MEKTQKYIDFLDISPFVRYAHHMPDANKENHIIPWRYIYDYEFIFVAQGCMEVQTDTESYMLDANTIHIMPPLVWHRRLIPDGQFCNYYSVHFDFLTTDRENDFSPEDTYISNCNKHNIKAVPVDEKLYQRTLYVLGDIEIPKKLHISDPIAYTEVLNRIITAAKEKAFAYEIDLKCNMLMLLKQILSDVRLHISIKGSGNTENLSAITQYILDNYQTDIDFNSLCHMYGCSYSHFRKLFKLYSGKTPNEFLIDVRIQKAVELLYTRQYSVTDVAFMVGYTDSSYFSRVFRKRKGCSPTDFVYQNDQTSIGKPTE